VQPVPSDSSLFQLPLTAFGFLQREAEAEGRSKRSKKPKAEKRDCTFFSSMYFVDVSKKKRFQIYLKNYSEIGK
jgi:hypothetical protein